MVWGCFWGGGRSELYILSRDFESEKHGYSANSYIEVLDYQLPACWQPGLTFMHGGASIHTAYKVRDWFVEMGILVCDWPPYPPDLNPIEHVWKKLKEMVFEMHPELSEDTGEENIRDALGKALQEAWDAIPESFSNSLIESMESWVKAVIKAKGWHKRY
jgi:transposase